MIILYILLVAYIFAINFYAFLLVKGLRDKERQVELDQQAAPLVQSAEISPKKEDKGLGKLFITGALGGAITIYLCMFLLKYKRSELLLMVLMPLLGVLNVYIFFMFFKSGFGFFLIR